MIELKHVYKAFGDKVVLDDISVQFERGKTNLIIGQSGSGKTVLLKSIVGLVEIDRGDIFYRHQGLFFNSIIQLSRKPNGTDHA